MNLKGIFLNLRWVPGKATLPDIREDALDRAIRAVLFADEAKKRKLSLPDGTLDVRASWVQVLLQQELLSRKMTRDQISDDEAVRYYNENKEFFHQIDTFETQWIVVTEAQKAEAIYKKAEGKDFDGFALLVKEYSLDEKTKGIQGKRTVVAGRDEEQVLLKVVMSTRKPGKVAGPFQLTNGQYAVVRIHKSPIEHAKEMDEKLKTTIKNAMVDEKRKSVSDELFTTLKSKAKIEIFHEHVRAVSSTWNFKK